MRGIKIIISIKEVMPIKDKGLELDFIIALHVAWNRADKSINKKIKLIVKVMLSSIKYLLLHSSQSNSFDKSFLCYYESNN